MSKRKIWRKFFLTHAFICLGIIDLSADNPGWTDYAARKEMYPESTWLVGFSSDVIRNNEKPEEVLQKLTGYAKTQLTEAIQVTIKSTATLNLENLNTSSLEQFRQASVSTSKVNLTGLKTESFYNKKKKEAFAICYVKKAELVLFTRSMLEEKTAEMDRKLEAAKQYSATGDAEKALKTFYQCYPLLREMEEEVTLILALGRDQASVNPGQYEVAISKGIFDLRQKRQLTLDEVCIFMADGIRQQISVNDLEGLVGLASFTYQDTKMGSLFSVRLNCGIEQKFVKEGFKLHNASLAGAIGTGDQGDRFTLSGTYWEEDDNLKIIANLRDNKTGRTVASDEELLPKSWLKTNNIKYLPENYSDALSRIAALSNGQITNGGLLAEVLTNKGAENPVFSKGDTMRLYIRVNRPCYVRVIYYLANGARTLLLNSEFLGDDKVNKLYMLPDLFTCDSPFGAETLQLVAQTEPFKQLITMKRYGYYYIQDDLSEILANVRGMKRVDNQTINAESRVEITTVP
jgi:hypothetical protein